MGVDVLSKVRAIESQRRIYDAAVKEKKGLAYGSGVLQEILYEKRIGLAAKYVKSGDSVLDLGCGDGTVSRAIAEIATFVDAVDVSGEAISLARAVNNRDNMCYHCASIEDYGSEKCYDLILMYEVIEHVVDPAHILRKAGTLLKVGGRLIISTPNKSRLDASILSLLKTLRIRKYRNYEYQLHEDHINEYSHDEIAALLRDSGFRIKRQDGLFLSLKFARKISTAPLMLKLSAFSGNLAPCLAHHLYFVSEKQGLKR